MADKTVDQETAGSAITDTDLFRGVQSGDSVKFSFTQVKAWIRSWIAKADVGLANVDNTSDANKPLSNAMAVPYAVGDMLYASGATALSKLVAVAAGQPIISAGVTTAPIYSGNWLEFSVANKRVTVNKNTNGVLAPVNSFTGIHLHGQDSPTEMSVEIHAYGSDGVYNATRSNGAIAARTPLAANDYVGTFTSAGIAVNGGTMEQGNSITFRATENWTVGARGMMTAFFGNMDGSTTFGEWARFRNGRLGIGDTNPTAKLTLNKNATSGIADPFTNPDFNMIGADSGGTFNMSQQTFGASTQHLFYRANGTNAAKTALASGDLIGSIGFFGYAGATSGYNGGVTLRGVAGEAFGTGAAGTRFEIYTTPSGSVTNAVAITLYGSKGAFLGAAPADPTAGVLQTTGGVISPSFVVASLPTGQTGKTVFASNARVFNLGTGVQEGAGAGTGSLVTYNGTAWRTPSNNQTVVA